MAFRKRQPENLAEAYEGMKQDYTAAKMSRFRRLRTGMLTTIGTGADYHYRIQSDYLKMMEYARDMDRNDAIIGQGVDRAVQNMIQGGLIVDPQTGDPKLDIDLRDRFNDWAEDADQCDIAGESSFADMQFQAMRATIVDGDMFAIPTTDGALQLTEAHRCRTPSGTRRNVVNGILLDDNRRRLEYWFTKNDVDPFQVVQLVSDITPIAARDDEGFRNVFHIFSPKRISQSRGVTAFAPCFDTAGMLEDINFSAVVRQQVSNCFALIRERNEYFTRANPTPLGIQGQETMPNGTVRQLQGVGPGMEIAGAVGETLKMDGSHVPSNEFFQHVRLMLQIVGVNIGMPLVLMLMDASETNFSGWRGAFEQAKLGFTHNQKWFARKLCRPTYVWKIRQFIGEDAAIRRAFEKLKEKLFSHRWNAPRWPYIQPLQEAQADAMRVEKRLTSPRRMSAEKGIEYADILSEIVEDNKAAILKAINAAQDIASQTQQKVDWHELLFITNEAPINTTNMEPLPAGPGAPPMPPSGSMIPGAPKPKAPTAPAPAPAPKSQKDEDDKDDEGDDKSPDDEEDGEE